MTWPLSPPATGRWTPARKEEVVLAITSGDTTLAQACAALSLDPSEVNGWIARFDAHGRPGLAVHRLQEHGRSHERRSQA